MSAAAQVIVFPRRWCLAVEWIDVDGRHRVTAVRGCHKPEIARRSVLVHHADQVDGFLGAPYPIPERA